MGLVELLLMILWKLFGYTYDKVEDRVVNNVLKNSSDPNKWWYVDRYGRRIDKKTNHIVLCQHINNETLEIDCVTGEVLVNYTELKRQKIDEENRLKAIQDGKTTYILYHRPKGYEYVKKTIYKDIKTDELYVSTYIGKSMYYISLKDGNIVRKTDETIKWERAHNVVNELSQKEINRYLLKIRVIKENPSIINHL